MAELKITGKVKVLLDEQSWDSGFRKREFVITTDEQYPQDVKFECVNDRISILDGLTTNDQIDVSFNVRGNEYQGRYYVNLQAWRVEKASNGGQDTPPSFEANTSFEPASEDETDDLPF